MILVEGAKLKYLISLNHQLLIFKVFKILVFFLLLYSLLDLLLGVDNLHHYFKRMKTVIIFIFSSIRIKMGWLMLLK